MATTDMLTADQSCLITALLEMSFQEACKTHDRELDVCMTLWSGCHDVTVSDEVNSRRAIAALHQSNFADILQNITRLRFPVPAEAWFGPRRER